MCSMLPYGTGIISCYAAISCFSFVIASVHSLKIFFFIEFGIDKSMRRVHDTCLSQPHGSCAFYTVSNTKWTNS